MKKYVVAIMLLTALIGISSATVLVKVFESDGLTPFDDRDIMVGAELTIIVSSASTDYWGGGLYVAGQNRALASLSAREFDPNALDWTGSHYDEAGDYAKVTAWTGTNIWGFDLYSSDSNSVSGDWFIIDYEAIGSGDPNVWIYDYADSFSDPNSTVSFTHVPSRDFNEDGVVNITDHSILASHWQVDDCNEPNWCDGTDINADGDVDFEDLALFADYWLWGVPETTVIVPDPNVTLSIVDANGLDEITIDVGESVTLYVDMTSGGMDVFTFYVEVNISDPNLGSIDNTAYDPNDPPGPGTARILADPSSSLFDDWGPGIEQEEGIWLLGASIGSVIDDGHLASFVFTCEGEGDVTLELLNQSSTYPANLEDILIHQNDPNSQQMMSGGMSMMLESSPPVSSQEMTLAEIVKILDDIWLSNDGIQEAITGEDWLRFMNDVKKSY